MSGVVGGGQTGHPGAAQESFWCQALGQLNCAPKHLYVDGWPMGLALVWLEQVRFDLWKLISIRRAGLTAALSSGRAAGAWVCLHFMACRPVGLFASSVKRKASKRAKIALEFCRFYSTALQSLRHFRKRWQ